MPHDFTAGRSVTERADVREPGRAGSGVVKVAVGGLEVIAPEPDARVVEANLTKSRTAMKGLAAALAKPGIRIYPRKGVPLYSADPEDPDVLIRKLDGRVERGAFVNGAFEVRD